MQIRVTAGMSALIRDSIRSMVDSIRSGGLLKQHNLLFIGLDLLLDLPDDGFLHLLGRGPGVDHGDEDGVHAEDAGSRDLV